MKQKLAGFSLPAIIVMVCFVLTSCGQQPTAEAAATPIVISLPDFSAYTDIVEKKKAFFDFLRPIIRTENARVATQREKMLVLSDRLADGKMLNADESQWLLALAEEYNVQMNSLDDEQAWVLLKRRVDTVPFRLALAQAANESAWGTARFAREGLNLFGQWCFSPGCGIVPSRRIKGMKHEVAAYPSVNASVGAYIRTINRVHMYTPLRKLRQRIVERGQTPTSIELAQELEGYSEKGEEYVREIRSLIRRNYDLMAGGSLHTQKSS